MSAIESTHWLEHIKCILSGAVRIGKIFKYCLVICTCDVVDVFDEFPLQLIRLKITGPR